MTSRRTLSRQALLIAWLLMTTVVFNCHWWTAAETNRWPLMVLYDAAVGAVVLALLSRTLEPNIVLYLLGGGLMSFAPPVSNWIRGWTVHWGTIWDYMLVSGVASAILTWIVLRAVVRPQSGDIDGGHMWRSAGLVGAWSIWGCQTPDGKYTDYARIILGTACLGASVWLTSRAWRRPPEPGEGRLRRVHVQAIWVVALLGLAWALRSVPCLIMLMGAG
jgi:hypothetical protein